MVWSFGAISVSQALRQCDHDSCNSLSHARNAGDLVKVVAVGGSVTTGMGARNGNESYVQRIHAWLRSLGTEDHPVRMEVTPSRASLHHQKTLDLELCLRPHISLMDIAQLGAVRKLAH
jgi:hypothetical protein